MLPLVLNTALWILYASFKKEIKVETNTVTLFPAET